jgi:hypothetical protein
MESFQALSPGTVVLAVSAVALSAIVFRRFTGHEPLASIPLFGLEHVNENERRHAYPTGAKKIYEDGYRKVRNHDQKLMRTQRDSRTLIGIGRLVQRWPLSCDHG